MSELNGAESQSNSINAEGASIKSDGNVEFIGGNQYKFGDNIINVDIAAPSYGTSVDKLQLSLESNRKTLREDLKHLEELVRKELDLQDGRIQAVVKDIITGSKNIELLIPAIKLNGGSAKSQPFESNTIVTINTAIAKGQKEMRTRMKEKLVVKVNNSEKALKKAKRFKFFRTKEQKVKDLTIAEFNLKKSRIALEITEDFLEKTKDL